MSFSKGLLQFITINAVARSKARPLKLYKFNAATGETGIMMGQYHGSFRDSGGYSCDTVLGPGAEGTMQKRKSEAKRA